MPSVAGMSPTCSVFPEGLGPSSWSIGRVLCQNIPDLGGCRRHAV